MNRNEADSRLTALEQVHDPVNDEQNRDETTEMFTRMIAANVASGNIWSAYRPDELVADIERRITDLQRLATDAPEPAAGTYLAMIDWMTDALRCARDDVKINRPVLNCADRLQPLGNISHVEMIGLWFGLEAGADWHVAETIDNA
jgi:hypothetical protein